MAGDLGSNDLADSTDLPLRVRVRSITTCRMTSASATSSKVGRPPPAGSAANARNPPCVREGVAGTVRGLVPGRSGPRSQTGRSHEHAGIDRTVQQGGLTRIRVPQQPKAHGYGDGSDASFHAPAPSQQSRLSFAMRAHRQRRSISILVSPGPRTDTLTGCRGTYPPDGTGGTSPQTRNMASSCAPLSLRLTLSGLGGRKYRESGRYSQ